MKNYRIIEKIKTFQNGVTSKKYFIQHESFFGWKYTKINVYYPRGFETKEKYTSETYEFCHLEQAKTALEILKKEPIVYKGFKIRPFVEDGGFACWWVTCEKNRYKKLEDFYSYIDNRLLKKEEINVIV